MSNHRYDDTLGPLRLQIFRYENKFPKFKVLLYAIVIWSIGIGTPSRWVSLFKGTPPGGWEIIDLQSCWSSLEGGSLG